MDIGQLTLADFEPLIGDSFEIATDDGSSIALELIRVDALGNAPEEGMRAPFALLFHGPADTTFPQQTLTLTHAKLGALELFLVPTARSETTASYEVVFA